MENVVETLTSKKLDSWGSNLNNFKADKELTVEITLAEYRDLIKSDATRKVAIDEANSDKYSRDNENQKLKKENKELEMKLFEYRKKFGGLETKTEEESEIEEE